METRRRRGREKPTSPESMTSLAAELETGKEGQAECLPARIARYSRAKKRAAAMRDYLMALGESTASKAAGLLCNCGNYLHFRHYFTVDRVLLHAACFCKQHLICPLCAIRRGSKTLEAYLDRFRVIQADRPDLKPYLMTITVKDGEDLAERFRHLSACFQVLKDRRRRCLSGNRGAPWTEFAKVVGAVGSYEFKRGKNSGLWHPHLHMVILCASEPLEAMLRSEWEGITGDSFMIDVRPFYGDQDPAQGFMEVMKYAVKFSSMSLADNWEVAQLLRRSRLLFSLGVFRGVQVPESLTDEPLENLPYFDLFYRYFAGSGYSLTGECPSVSGVEPMDTGGLSIKDVKVLLAYRRRQSAESWRASSVSKT